MLITLLGAPGHWRWLLGGATIVVLGVLVPLTDGDLFRIYGSRAEAIAAQKAQRYVLVGTVGRADWPAIAVARERGDGAVSFVSAAGRKHQYQGFKGPMKALEFRAGLTGDKRFTLVFHRVDKAPVDRSPFKDIP